MKPTREMYQRRAEQAFAFFIFVYFSGWVVLTWGPQTVLDAIDFGLIMVIVISVGWLSRSIAENYLPKIRRD